MIIKTDETNKTYDENQGIEYKYNFFGVLPPKNKSFS